MIRALVEDCARGAAFVGMLRDAATRAPHYRLDDLAAIDERLEGHLDALRVARRAGWTIAAQALDDSSAGPGEVFVAATLAFAGDDEDRADVVREAALAAPDRPRAAAAALAWLPWRQAAPWVEQHCASDDATLARIGIAAAAAHRRDPGATLDAALVRGDVALRRRALRAAGELGRVDLLRDLKGALDDDDAGCRLEAGCSVALLGAAEAAPVLRALVQGGHPDAARAGAMAARCLPAAEACGFLLGLANRRAAIIGAGALGDPALLRWLVAGMEHPALRRVAGEAFVMICGAPTVGDLVGARPAGHSSGPSDDPDDDDVALDPDDALPWLKPEAAGAWLDRHAGSFIEGKRYLLGQPIEGAWLAEVLAHGGQRQRAAAALELALANPTAPLFEVRAPARRQLAALAALAARSDA